MPATNRESGLDAQQVDLACQRISEGATLRDAAAFLSIPWQRLLFIARDRGIVRPNGRPVFGPAPTASQPRAARRPSAARTPDVLTFGIEIECYAPTNTISSGQTLAAAAFAGSENWKVKFDGSLNSAPLNHHGVEVVSPILSGPDGVRQVMDVCNYLRSIGAKVNRSCGFHVHVGWTRTRSTLARLIRLVAKNEKAIYAAAGTKSRETSQYCRPITSNACYRALATGSGRLPAGHYARYHLLNLCNLARGGKQTVEFRAFQGTTNAKKILAYVFVCLGLVQKSIDNASDAPEGFATEQPATGAAAVEILLADLGWGNCCSFGLISEPTAPSTIALAFELGRLAQKYDGNTVDAETSPG